MKTRHQNANSDKGKVTNIPFNSLKDLKGNKGKKKSVYLLFIVLLCVHFMLKRRAAV